MRLVIAALFVTLLAPAHAIACEDEGGQATQRHDQARARRQAQRQAMRQARREADRARRDLDRARRDAERAMRDARRPQVGPQPIDPYQDGRSAKPYKDPKDAKDKLEKLQKKLDKLRDRLGRFQVPQNINDAPKRPMRIEIQPMPEGEIFIDFDGSW
jgi:hypothetical protein